MRERMKNLRLKTRVKGPAKNKVSVKSGFGVRNILILFCLCYNFFAMKKGLIIIVLSLCMLLVFSGCGFFTKAPIISQMEFSLSSGTPGSDSYNEFNLVVKPDNELRTLAILYVQNFSNDIYEDKEMDGVIGGNFFDRFEEILKQFEDSVETQSELDLVEPGKLLFTIKLNENEDRNFVFDAGDSSMEYQLVKSFYSDVIELFSEDVY